MQRRQLLTVLVTLAVLLAGCSALGSGGQSAPASGNASFDADAEDVGGGAQAAPRSEGEQVKSTGGDAGGDGVPDAQRRAVIKRGNMTLTVTNYSEARAAVAGHARDRGGFVAGAAQSRHVEDNRSWRTGYVVLKVPADSFEAFVADAKGEGTLEAYRSSERDVSDQLVDLEARIENKERERDRLQSFLEEANSTDELLRIQNRLSTVQQRIERLKAQKRSLERDVSYSTLRVQIQEPEPEPPEQDDADAGTTLRGAFVGSIESIAATGHAGLVGLAAATPWLLLVGVPALTGRWLARRRYGSVPAMFVPWLREDAGDPPWARLTGSAAESAAADSATEDGEP